MCSFLTLTPQGYQPTFYFVMSTFLGTGKALFPFSAIIFFPLNAVRVWRAEPNYLILVLGGTMAVGLLGQRLVGGLTVIRCNVISSHHGGWHISVAKLLSLGVRATILLFMNRDLFIKTK